MNYTDLYALSRYFDANSGAVAGPQASSTSQIESKENSELRQHQLSANEPVALMPLVEGSDDKDDEEDEDTRKCKKLFKNIKFFLGREIIALEKQYHDELKMELEGLSSAVPNAEKQFPNEESEANEDSLPDLQLIPNDHANLSKVVMSRKKRKLYEAMQIGKERKKAQVDTLKKRKDKLRSSET